MKTKYSCCLFFGAGILFTCSLAVIAKRPPVTYGDNQFDWFADVPRKPGGNNVVSSHIELFGSGGIKVNSLHENGGDVAAKYLIYIDGSDIAPSVKTFKVDADFNASRSCAYFVSRTATCTLPSAVESAGKEVLVWNAGQSVSVRYNTTMGQTISGSAPGALVNSKPYSLERFMSDGSNWFKE